MRLLRFARNDTLPPRGGGLGWGANENHSHKTELLQVGLTRRNRSAKLLFGGVR